MCLHKPVNFSTLSTNHHRVYIELSGYWLHLILIFAKIGRNFFNSKKEIPVYDLNGIQFLLDVHNITLSYDMCLQSSNICHRSRICLPCERRRQYFYSGVESRDTRCYIQIVDVMLYAFVKLPPLKILWVIRLIYDLL